MSKLKVDPENIIGPINSSEDLYLLLQTVNLNIQQEYNKKESTNYDEIESN